MSLKSLIPSAFLFVLFIAAATVGEEAQPPAPAQPPLQVLADCLKAIENHDFAAYVDHLTPEAQRFQAGLAVYFSATASQAVDVDGAADPQTQLLIAALNDLLERHSIPSTAQTPAQMAAVEARTQITGQLFMQALMAAGATAPPAATNSQTIRQNCIEAAGVLKDCKVFLIAALHEVSQPTQVSGAARQETIKPIDLNEMTAVYRIVQWRLYTRGNYAMALANVPLQEDFPSGPDVSSSTPGSNNSTPSELRVDFRKMNGIWKINRIVPFPTVSPQISPANISSADVYRSDAPPVVPPTSRVR